MPDEFVRRRWAIVHRPGRVPEMKRPLAETDEALLVLLRELVGLYPGATVTAVELTWHDDLWVSDAREELAIAAACQPCHRARVV